MMSLVRWESTVRVFLLPVSTPGFTPGFTPGSLPDLLPVPGLTQSHSITVLGAENAGSTEGWLSLSHCIIIHRSLLRWFF
jgi:hypothetical protein